MLLPIALGGAGLWMILGPKRANAAARRSTLQEPSVPTFGVIARDVVMRLSAAGLKALKDREGFRSRVYDDSAGHATIGYGHKLTPDELAAGLSEVTEFQAAAMLERDIGDAARAVNDAIRVPMEQREFDAMVSLAFNIGGQAFRDSTLAARFNAGDVQGAGAEFSRWVYAGGRKVAGLVARRRAEQAQFMGAA